MTDGPDPKLYKVHIYAGRKGILTRKQWRARIVSKKNWKSLFVSSEGYNNREELEAICRAVYPGLQIVYVMPPK